MGHLFRLSQIWTSLFILNFRVTIETPSRGAQLQDIGPLTTTMAQGPPQQLDDLDPKSTTTTNVYGNGVTMPRKELDTLEEIHIHAEDSDESP